MHSTAVKAMESQLQPESSSAARDQARGKGWPSSVTKLFQA